MSTRRLHDVDLAGGFRLDLKTGLLLGALLWSWWDQRGQADKRAAVEEVRSSSVSETLSELKRLQAVQQYDISAIKLTLAENGIKVKKGE